MSNGSDDYIRTFGRTVMVNTFLKYAVFILGLSCLGLSITVISLLGKIHEIRPLPIYIDKMTGAAKPIDFASIDASEAFRIPAEIIDFSRNYVSDLYTFNRHTIASNLDPVFKHSVGDVVQKLKYYLDQNHRADYVNSNAQGICSVNFTDIVRMKPDIKVQVAFKREILSGKGETLSSEDMVAIMRIKLANRTAENSHGLMVVEYRESKLKEFTYGKNKE